MPTDNPNQPAFSAAYYAARGMDRQEVYAKIATRFPWLEPEELENARDLGFMVFQAGRRFGNADPQTRLEQMEFPQFGEGKRITVHKKMRFVGDKGQEKFIEISGSFSPTASKEDVLRELETIGKQLIRQYELQDPAKFSGMMFDYQQEDAAWQG